MTAVIAAGGAGTRLAALGGDLPKALVPVAGKPVLERQLVELVRSGVDRVFILTGHLSAQIERFVRNLNLQLPIECFREEVPLGSAGGLHALKGRIDSDFIFLHGDIVFSADLERMVLRHRSTKATVTIAVHPNSHPHDSDLADIAEDGTLMAIVPKGKPRDRFFSNLATAGLYVMKGEVLQRIAEQKHQDLEADVIAEIIPTRRVQTYRTSEYIKDMGTIERLHQVESDLEASIVSRKRLSERQRAVFLDRDGTVTTGLELVSRPDQLHVAHDAAAAVRIVNESGWLCFLVTNQPAAARGLCTVADLVGINRKLETELGRQGAYFDDIRFCPHHPDRGFPEEDATLKIDCSCRKPKTGMIEELARLYNIDVQKSAMVGDTTVDLQTAHNTGMRGILVMTGEKGRDGRYDAKPDAAYSNLVTAVTAITKEVGGNGS